MSTESSEVRALLSVMTAKILDSRDPLNSQAVGNSLYGLCGLVSGSFEDESKCCSAIFERLVAELDRNLSVLFLRCIC